MSSQFSNSLAISNMLTAHLKNSNQLAISTTPPPLFKSNVMTKDLTHQLLLQRASNRLSNKQWEQLNYEIDSPQFNSSYLMNGSYLNQLLTQQRKSSLESTLKLIDYNRQLNLSSHLSNHLLNNQNNQLTSRQLANKSDDEQDLVLDLSKATQVNKTTKHNAIKLSLSTSSNKLIKHTEEIRRPSSLPQPKSTQLTNKSLQGISKKKSNSSSSKKAARKIPFDEFKSSPVSGTFILTDNDVALSEFCRNGDIDPNYNRVQITAETRADLQKIENHIGDYLCRLCKLCFDDAFGLAQHRCSRIVHIEYKCPDCSKEFSCPANLASHRRWHKPSKQAGAVQMNKTTTNKVEAKKPTNQIILTSSNNSSKLSSLLSSSRSSTPLSPKVEKEPIIQQKINIKVNDQIVSLSVTKDDQQINCNNKVKVTKTAILPKASDEDKIEIKETLNKANESEIVELVEKSTGDKAAANEELVSSTNDDNYCPKKFRRQQYLNKSPRSENQENEIMNFNITDESNQLNEQDCQSLNNSCNSTSAKSLVNSSINVATICGATPRKKRARSSVTTDEQTSQIRIEETDSIDEQVFSDQSLNDDSSVSFESQKKFLILKKLKSEQN